MDALFEVAASSELMRQMLDAYSYKDLTVKVNRSSLAAGSPSRRMISSFRILPVADFPAT
jgi:hypothetical protein